MVRRREVHRHLSNAADHVALTSACLHDTIVKEIELPTGQPTAKTTPPAEDPFPFPGLGLSGPGRSP